MAGTQPSLLLYQSRSLLLIIIWKFVNVRDHRYEYINGNGGNYETNNRSNGNLINYTPNNHSDTKERQTKLLKNNKHLEHTIEKKSSDTPIEAKAGLKRQPLDIKGAVTLGIAIISIYSYYVHNHTGQVNSFVSRIQF